VVDKRFQSPRILGHAKRLFDSTISKAPLRHIDNQVSRRPRLTCVNISFCSAQCSLSHPPSNTQMPLEPLRQLPVILSSSMV
jgi:hypothetical protein